MTGPLGDVMYQTDVLGQEVVLIRSRAWTGEDNEMEIVPMIDEGYFVLVPVPLADEVKRTGYEERFHKMVMALMEKIIRGDVAS